MATYLDSTFKRLKKLIGMIHRYLTIRQKSSNPIGTDYIHQKINEPIISYWDLKILRAKTDFGNREGFFSRLLKIIAAVTLILRGVLSPALSTTGCMNHELQSTHGRQFPTQYCICGLYAAF